MFLLTLFTSLLVWDFGSFMFTPNIRFVKANAQLNVHIWTISCCIHIFPQVHLRCKLFWTFQVLNEVTLQCTWRSYITVYDQCIIAVWQRLYATWNVHRCWVPVWRETCLQRKISTSYCMTAGVQWHLCGRGCSTRRPRMRNRLVIQPPWRWGYQSASSITFW